MLLEWLDWTLKGLTLVCCLLGLFRMCSTIWRLTIQNWVKIKNQSSVNFCCRLRNKEMFVCLPLGASVSRSFERFTIYPLLIINIVFCTLIKLETIRVTIFQRWLSRHALFILLECKLTCQALSLRLVYCIYNNANGKKGVIYRMC